MCLTSNSRRVRVRGIVLDERFAAFNEALVPLESHLGEVIDAQGRAEEEQANRETLRAIQPRSAKNPETRLLY
jgi:hypothetical protein